MGDVAIGIITACHYDYTHRSAMNDEFVQAYVSEFHRNPDFFSVGGYDGMRLIDLALKKPAARPTANSLIEAAKGCAVGKPARADRDRPGNARHRTNRLYPQSRESRAAGCVNVEFDEIENVKDPVKAR